MKLLSTINAELGAEFLREFSYIWLDRNKAVAHMRPEIDFCMVAFRLIFDRLSASDNLKQYLIVFDHTQITASTFFNCFNALL